MMICNQSMKEIYKTTMYCNSLHQRSLTELIHVQINLHINTRKIDILLLSFVNVAYGIWFEKGKTTFYIYCNCTGSITAYTWIGTGSSQAHTSKIIVTLPTFAVLLKAPAPYFPATTLVSITTWHWACLPHQNTSNEFIWSVFSAFPFEPAWPAFLKFCTSAVTIESSWSCS